MRLQTSVTWTGRGSPILNSDHRMLGVTWTTLTGTLFHPSSTVMAQHQMTSESPLPKHNHWNLLYNLLTWRYMIPTRQSLLHQSTATLRHLSPIPPLQGKFKQHLPVYQSSSALPLVQENLQLFSSSNNHRSSLAHLWIALTPLLKPHQGASRAVCQFMETASMTEFCVLDVTMPAWSITRQP